jgi:hypothetical protein
MARTADKNSVRQQGFKILDELRGTKREDAIDILMKKLDIGKSYAATIHATHRTLDKERGLLVTYYSVEEYKDGKKVVPYLKKTTAYRPSSLLQRLTKKEAIEAWMLEVEERKQQVLTLG